MMVLPILFNLKIRLDLMQVKSMLIYSQMTIKFFKRLFLLVNTTLKEATLIDKEYMVYIMMDS